MGLAGLNWGPWSSGVVLLACDVGRGTASSSPGLSMGSAEGLYGLSSLSESLSAYCCRRAPLNDMLPARLLSRSSRLGVLVSGSVLGRGPPPLPLPLLPSTPEPVGGPNWEEGWVGEGPWPAGVRALGDDWRGRADWTERRGG